MLNGMAPRATVLRGRCRRAPYRPPAPMCCTVKTLWDAYAGQVTDDIYLDWVEVDYDRSLVAVNKALAFRAAAPLQRYQLGSFT